MIDFLWYKIEAILGALAAVIGIFLWGRHQAKKRCEAEAKAKVAERVAETVKEQGERREKVEGMSDSELIDYLRRDRR